MLVGGAGCNGPVIAGAGNGAGVGGGVVWVVDSSGASGCLAGASWARNIRAKAHMQSAAKRAWRRCIFLLQLMLGCGGAAYGCRMTARAPINSTQARVILQYAEQSTGDCDMKWRAVRP